MREPGLRASLYAIGLVQIVAGAVFWASPSTLLDLLGDGGGASDHYVRYLAAGLIAPGIGLAIAARRDDWRVPLLVVGAMLNALLALNGVLASLVAAAGAAYLAVVSERLSRPGSSSGA
jgi:hypothetical protein